MTPLVRLKMFRVHWLHDLLAAILNFCLACLSHLQLFEDRRNATWIISGAPNSEIGLQCYAITRLIWRLCVRVIDLDKTRDVTPRLNLASNSNFIISLDSAQRQIRYLEMKLKKPFKVWSPFFLRKYLERLLINALPGNTHYSPYFETVV